VIIYFNEFKIRALLQATPAALHSRAFADMEQNLSERGVVVTNTGNGYFVANISRARREDVFSWLDSYAACVDVQRDDVATILGRNIDSLVLIRAFDNYPNQIVPKLSRLAPDEIYEGCQNLSYQFQAHANQIEENPLEVAVAVDDLEAAGLLRPDEGNASRLDPKPPPPDREMSPEFRTEEEPNYFDPFYSDDPRNVAGF